MPTELLSWSGELDGLASLVSKLMSDLFLPALDRTLFPTGKGSCNNNMYLYQKIIICIKPPCQSFCANRVSQKWSLMVYLVYTISTRDIHT